MKGFIEVTAENVTQLLNVKYIELVQRDEDGKCTIFLAYHDPDAVEQDYVTTFESYDEIKRRLEEAMG